MGKADSYIGFAIKSRAVAYGAGAVEKSRHVHLIILDSCAAKNSMRLAAKLQKKKNCPLLVSKKSFVELFGKDDCKVAGITDKYLAAAVVAAEDEDYLKVSESEEVKDE